MLAISQLSLTYPGGVKALDQVSLHIGKGVFGLLGPNGAGKSTLMRTIAALQAPDSGSIAFDGVDIVAYPHVVRQALGYLPQEFGVYPRISAEELLAHLAVLKGVADRRSREAQVAELLHLTHLYAVRRQAVSTFSGGMRQRFGIAQALLGAPRLIIVDEPTAGLDPEERHRFHDLLSEIGEQVVVILSTHIVADVHELCGDMAILAGGRVLVQGRPQRLVSSLEGRVWRKTVTRGEVEDHAADFQVISTRLASGQTQVIVLDDEVPGPGFVAQPPDLETAYFAHLFAAQRGLSL